MTIAEKRIEWETRIKEWQESGLSAAQWCKEQNLNIHQMYYWKRKLMSKNSEHRKADWFSVEVKEPPTQPPSSSILIHVDEYSIEVPSGADSRQLADILRVLS